MRFVAISDTHGKHMQLTLPEGDVIIHAGDVSMRGEQYEIEKFLNWFDGLDYQHKIFIAGNHDFYFERTAEEEIQQLIPSSIIYLNDSTVNIGSIKIWGSPISPWFFNWAFNRHRGTDIKKHWNLIPDDVNIVVTHGPVYKILDRTVTGKSVGCEDLLQKLNEVQPAVHICGHIHEAYGSAKNEHTQFYNVSILNERYQVVNQPMVFDL